MKVIYVRRSALSVAVALLTFLIGTLSDATWSASRALIKSKFPHNYGGKPKEPSNTRKLPKLPERLTEIVTPEIREALIEAGMEIEPLPPSNTNQTYRQPRK